MPRWKKGAREFVMNVNHNGLGSYLCRIPKPIVQMLDHPEKVKFTVRGKRVTFSVAEEKDEE